VVDYSDVEKSDSNTAACFESVGFKKLTCESVDYCEMWNRTTMYCLWFVKKFTKYTL